MKAEIPYRSHSSNRRGLPENLRPCRTRTCDLVTSSMQDNPVPVRLVRPFGPLPHIYPTRWTTSVGGHQHEPTSNATDGAPLRGCPDVDLPGRARLGPSVPRDGQRHRGRSFALSDTRAARRSAAADPLRPPWRRTVGQADARNNHDGAARRRRCRPSGSPRAFQGACVRPLVRRLRRPGGCAPASANACLG